MLQERPSMAQQAGCSLLTHSHPVLFLSWIVQIISDGMSAIAIACTRFPSAPASASQAPEGHRQQHAQQQWQVQQQQCNQAGLSRRQLFAAAAAATAAGSLPRPAAGEHTMSLSLPVTDESHEITTGRQEGWGGVVNQADRLAVGGVTEDKQATQSQESSSSALLPARSLWPAAAATVHWRAA